MPPGATTPTRPHFTSSASPRREPGYADFPAGKLVRAEAPARTKCGVHQGSIINIARDITYRDVR